LIRFQLHHNAIKEATMWQPDTTSDLESFAPDRSVRFLLGSIGATAAAMTGAIAAASGAVSIDVSPAFSVWPMAAVGALLVAIGIAVRKPIVAGARSMNSQSVLAVSGVAVALLLSFVFVNRVTEALSPSSVETETATFAYQNNEHTMKSSANSRAELLSCEDDGTGKHITAVWVSHPHDI
jgi:uncharacterized membrane protein YedE/YeeE